MHAEGIQRVVITEPGFHLEAEEPGNQPGRDADDHRARWQSRIRKPE